MKGLRMFTEILENLLNESPAILGAAVVSDDGIIIEHLSHDEDSSPFEYIAAEFSILVKSALESVRSTLEDSLTEFVLSTNSRTLVLRPLDSEYFVLLILESSGLTGKSRFLLKRDLPKIEEALAP